MDRVYVPLVNNKLGVNIHPGVTLQDFDVRAPVAWLGFTKVMNHLRLKKNRKRDLDFNGRDDSPLRTISNHHGWVRRMFKGPGEIEVERLGISSKSQDGP